MADPIDISGVVSQYLDQQKTDIASQARFTMSSAVAAKPDYEVELRNVAQRTGVPVDTVRAYPDELKQQATLQQFDFDAMARDFPRTTAFLADPTNAAISHDDTASMSGVESALTAVAKAARYVTSADAQGGLLRDVGAGAFRASAGAAGVFRAAAELPAVLLDPFVGNVLPINPLRAIGAGFGAMGDRAEASAKALSPANVGLVGNAVSSGVQSLTQNLLSLPLAFLPGGQGAALTMMAGGAGGQAYQQARSQGLSAVQALPFAVSQGVIEYATEKLPMHLLLKDLNAGTAIGKTMLRNMATEIPGEQVATVLQDMNEWAVLPENREKPFSSYLADRPSAAASTLIATVIGVGGQVGVMQVLQTAADNAAGVDRKAQAAEQAATQVEQLTAVADQSKLRERDPATFRQFVESVAATNADGATPTEFYVDAAQLQNSLNQSGVSREELAALAPSIAAQLQPENIVPGVDLRIPVADLLAVPSEISGGLIDHLRASPDALTRAEATQMMEAQGESIRQDVDSQMAQAEQQDATAQQSTAVREHFERELAAAGRFRPEVNAAYASLLGSFYETQAERAGIAPQELLDRYQLRVAAQETPGRRRLDQSAGRPRAALSFSDDITTAPSVIALMKGADLSSFIHESGHFFLEVQADLAARIQGLITDSDTVSAGERQIVADMDTLLTSFGITGTPDQSALTTWLTMSLEEKREHHETFARGFERYAMEGTAPSQALQGAFQRFRSWLIQVYKQLSNLNVQLTDDVRGVMARMLASDAAIQQAQDARAMGPLFQTPEQAGMTPEEFAEYHALAQLATDRAVSELDARLLKDMKWLSNAKDKALKARQKQVAALRSEVMIEVRGEVMAEPVYRAWQFLTSRISPAVSAAMKKRNARTLNPGADNLFTAIAKLGGLNKDAVESQWGKQDKLDAGVFGMPLLRKEGLSIDAMAEQLVEVGYLLPNEDGKADLAVFEELFADQARGVDRFSIQHDYGGEQPTESLVDPDELRGKLNTEDLKNRYGDAPDALWRILSARRMTNAQGIDADVLAESFGYTSGDHLVRELAAAEPPAKVIEALTDQRMLERHGDITSPAALQRAAEEAIHNEVRGRVLATELKAQASLAVREPGARGRGSVDVLARAAREFAEQAIARQRVRDLRPGQYTAAEARSARLAEKTRSNLEESAQHKRNQLINNYAAKATMRAQDEVAAALKYFARIERSDTIDPDYKDQIAQLLERYQLKPESIKAADRRRSLAEWVKSQEEMGIEPDIPADLLNGVGRQSYRDMTVEEMRGLLDTVKMIEHLGRMKNKLLTAKDQRTYAAARDALEASILANGRGRQADTRTPTTKAGRWLQAVKNFGAAHIKAATWARIMDGGKDGGAVWENFIRGANEAGDMETTMRAEATRRLTEIMAPVMKGRKMGGRGQYFPTLGRSLNREAIFTIALNTGNEGNLQRLLGGEGWRIEQIKPALDTLDAADWQAVQQVWDFFESYRPLIAAKERRVLGKEPNWVEPTPVVTNYGTLKGGYFPIKYDPAASVRAEEHADAEGARQLLKGAYGAATTRRSFTKSRVEEVAGRPLLYTLHGMYSGANDVIHDLAWHEWLIDSNRLLRSDKVDTAMRETYGPAAVRQFKSWRDAVAAGDSASQEAIDRGLAWLRQGVSVAGLGFNVMSAAMQPLGITQSIVRVGAGWVGKGVLQYVGAPIAKAREVNGKSDFMLNRARTRFRELNELRNKVDGQTAVRERINASAYVLMMRFQQAVDVPTWLGAYEKAVAGGNDEARSIALADQAVIDAQGGGQTKDLSAIERGGPAQKLFTVFYSFMNTALNVGVAQGMTNRNAAKTAVDMALLYVVPAVLGSLLKDALTPGGGDDDDDKLVRKLLAEQLGFLFGLVVIGREFGEAAKTVTGLSDRPRDYAGPAGVRMVTDAYAFGKQVGQGEFDDSFRKAAVNLTGDLFGLPSAQINRTITGAKALSEGETSNPAALVFGFQR